MDELIWIGNTLYPRSTVIIAAVLVVLALVAAYCLLDVLFKGKSWW